MYKIYIGEVPLFLVSKEQLTEFDSTNFRNLMVEHNHKRKRTLYRYIDNLEKGTKKYDAIIVFSKDLQQLKEDFFELFKVERAGGGLVFNAKNELLAIRRLGFWDLPKGKQEAGESIETTAIREVKEETGIKDVRCDKFLMDTYHCFRNKKDKRVLKWSSWYSMYSDDVQVTPQKEEAIELVEWVLPEQLKKRKPIYRNILDLLEQL